MEKTCLMLANEKLSKIFRLFHVDYGFGYADIDDPSTITYEEFIIRLADKAEKLQSDNKLLRDALENISNECPEDKDCENCSTFFTTEDRRECLANMAQDCLNKLDKGE